MPMAGEHRFGDVKRKVDKLCIECGFTKNGYSKVTRTVHGRRCHYPIPLVKGRKVLDRHVQLLKQRLGITDKEWDDA